MSDAILKKLSELEVNKQFAKNTLLIEFFLENHLFCSLKKNEYEIISDKDFGFSVNVFSNINLKNKGIFWIPIKFNEIQGYFDCEGNQLTSLIFSPYKVGTYFDCSHNLLKSLQYGPKIVGGDFICNNNKLKDFQYCPDEINGILLGKGNPIENLIYLPKAQPFIYLDNIKLLKYKPEAMNKIDFLNLCKSEFWYAEHLKEKALFDFQSIKSQINLSDDKKIQKPKL